MSARARLRVSPERGFAAWVDGALSPSRMAEVAHPEDWPDQTRSPGLPGPIWDHAVGDIARDILGRPSRLFRAQLCEVSWRLADGPGQVPAALPAMIEIIHAGSLIVDDIEDDSIERRGSPCLHRVHGVPRALNAGSWMYFLAMETVEQLAGTTLVRDRIRKALVDAMARCHLGQALDLSVPVGAIPRGWVYRTVATATMLKTGTLMELAARLGAVAAQAPDDRVEALAQFGRRLGLGLQMLDDFGNLNAPAGEDRDSKALEDLRNGRPTWPWARAELDLDETHFLDLQTSVRELVAAEDADSTHARALAAKLRMAVGLKGRRQAAGYLRNALRELRENVGERDELALLAGEIQRLEVSYG